MRPASISVAVLAAAGLTAASVQTAAPGFSAAQVERGRAVYAANCAMCHGDHLDDGQFAVPLKGPAFRAKWGGKGADGPFDFMTTMMPPSDPGSLGPVGYADVLAFVLSQNGVAPGSSELPPDDETLKKLTIPQ